MVRLPLSAERVFHSVQAACECLLGRATVPPAVRFSDVDSIPLADLVKGLRRIQKSIAFWTQEGGRKGYLDFVAPYVP